MDVAHYHKMPQKPVAFLFKINGLSLKPITVVPSSVIVLPRFIVVL